MIKFLTLLLEHNLVSMLKKFYYIFIHVAAFLGWNVLYIDKDENIICKVEIIIIKSFINGLLLLFYDSIILQLFSKSKTKFQQ